MYIIVYLSIVACNDISCVCIYDMYILCIHIYMCNTHIIYIYIKLYNTSEKWNIVPVYQIEHKKEDPRIA